MRKIENSEIISMFYGEMLRVLECPRNHIKHKFERYINLSLNFPDSLSKSSSSYYSSFSNYSSRQQAVKLEELLKNDRGEE